MNSSFTRHEIIPDTAHHAIPGQPGVPCPCMPEENSQRGILTGQRAVRMVQFKLSFENITQSTSRADGGRTEPVSLTNRPDEEILHTNPVCEFRTRAWLEVPQRKPATPA